MKYILLASLVVLTGCTSYGEYYGSVDGANQRQVEIAQAHAQSEAVRYQALMRIAESGDATAKVAATMALALGGQGRQSTQMAVPQMPQNEALQWASILVPGFTQAASIYYNAKVGMNASDNATKLGLSTNATFAGMAGQIAKDPLVVMQPDPLVVNAPDPVIVTQPDPVIVDPVVVQANAPVIVDPLVVTQPDPVIVNPVIVTTP